ncbi:MAG: Serine/threonine-protein kinase PknB, partial [Planctomycetota bacterium]
AAAAADACPVIDPGEPLGRVVAAACDPDPARRPHDAGAFRDLLARCRRDRQALLMVREARRRSQEAGESLTAHLRALAIAEEALRLRPDEPEVREAVAAVRAAYALAAIAQGDLSLAMGLVDPALPSHATIAATLAHALEARRRSDERQVRLEDLDRRSAGSWITVAEGTGGDWKVGGGSIQWNRGELRSSSYTRAGVISPLRMAGDVRIRAQLGSAAHPMARVGVFIAARAPVNTDAFPEDAYLVWVGAGGCGLLRCGVEVAAGPARMIPGRPVQIDLIRNGSRISAFVDGVGALTWTDPEPLGDEDRDRLGIAAWEGSATLLAWQVSRFGSPEVEDALDIAERQLLRGRHGTAADLVEDVLPTAVGARRERACRLMDQIREDEAQAERHRRTAAAIRKAIPGARISIRQGGLHVALPRAAGSLEPLRGMPVSGVECEADGTIADLGPLRGMPLRTLAVPGHRVGDLEPLAGSPLSGLVLNNNPLADLRPLAGLRLDRLVLARCAGIRDLSPLRDAPLRFLDLSHTELTDLGPLAGQALMDLWLIGSRIVDLGPLAGQPLQRLGLAGSGVSDLAPLAGSPLRVLHLEHSRVADLGPLAGSPIRYLNLAHAPVTDLGPLAGSPLGEVVLTGCAVEDVSPLAACPIRRLIYGPRTPAGLGRLPADCVLTYRSLAQQRG